MEKKTTITIKKDTHKDLMLFKIQTNAKNLDEVIRKAIKKLQGELKGDETPDASNSKNEGKEK